MKESDKKRPQPGRGRSPAAVRDPYRRLVFLLRPFPAAPLFWAIVVTQVVAVPMCRFGWLVPSISWTLIAAVRIYNLIWMVILGAVRLITERFANYRTDRHVKSIGIANQSLQPHITTSGPEPLAQS